MIAQSCDRTLFVLPEANKQHPAKYTDALLTTFARMLQGSARILDPFGGEGGVFMLERWLPEAQIESIELEPEWAVCHPKTKVGNALALDYPDRSFDAICTSPTYGNRLADKKRPVLSKWKKGVTTYADMLGRPLSADNTGALQWGPKYRAVHVIAWTEARRVLKPGGRFVLDIKDHYRNKKLQPVTDWHIEALTALGFVVQEHVKVDCPGMRYGQNGQWRVDYESVILFTLEAQP